MTRLLRRATLGAVALALISISVLVVLMAVAVMIGRAQHRADRTALQERWGLTDDELERYEEELPEMAAGIASALPPGTHSRKQIAAMAEEATLKAVLLKRIPRSGP